MLDLRNTTSRRTGFSLIEMLVVIGIILILAGILVPLVGRSWSKAKQTRMAFDMQTVVTGLEAYKHDTRAYPAVTAAGAGSKALADALIGPGDKAVDKQDGPGFRLHTGGKVYGPYLQPDKFRISNGTTDADALGKIFPAGCLLDGNGNPILYYPAHASVDVTATSKFIVNTGTYPVTDALYNYADNYVSSNPATYFTAPKMFQAMMGDLNASGNIDGSEKAAYTGSYVLWSAGPDGLFGPMGEKGQLQAGDTPTYNDVRRSDDVTNFQR